MKPLKILYITYIDMDTATSGSTVRPIAMLSALRAAGHDVTLIAGEQTRRFARWKTVLKALTRPIQADLCYIESPSGPIFNICDHWLLRKIKRAGIPTSIFYRDAYWMLDEHYQLRGLKRAVINAMHRHDLRVFRRTCDCVFFPTDSMARYFDFPHQAVLPPAGEAREPEEKKIFDTVVYAGCVSVGSGESMLLEAMDIVNRTRPVRLELIVRPKEMGPVEPYLDRDWLHVQHISGKELEDVYARSDFSVIPRKKYGYMDLSMPVKLFQCLSYNLPLIVTDCTEMQQFVESNHVGLSCADNPQALADAILEMYSDPQRIAQFRAACFQCMRRNRWSDRVDAMIEETLKTKEI